MSTATVETCENKNGCAASVRYVSPRVNVSETEEGFVLEAEMPGVNKDGLEVLLNANELTLLGRRTRLAEAGETLYRESSPHDFRRVFVLDPVIDAARIEARIERGVLKVRLPKAEKARPRKIEIA